jgi:hypothetical protein
MKLMFVGDLNLGEYYTNLGNGPGTYAKTMDLFEKVSYIFSSADLVAGNLEAAISTVGLNPEEPESAVLRAAPGTAKLLKKNNFKIVQVANNHTIQHGQAAFDECIGILKQNEIAFTGLNGAEPTVIEIHGKKIGFLAASDVPDNTDKQQSIYQRLDEEFIKHVESSVNKVDYLIVMLHWGLEESTAPLPYQRDLAKRLKKAGVKIIIGSHPHLFYEIEADGDFTCAYSLGNFVFDLCWDKRLLKTGILEVNIDDSGKLHTFVWPAIITKDGSLPVPSGERMEIVKSQALYNLGKDIKNQQIKKVVYHLSNIFRGKTKLKLIFFKRKIFK